MKINKYLLFLLTLFFFSCATASRITPKLYIGMTKEDVIKACGRPYKAGARYNPETDETIEAISYRESFYETPIGNWVNPPKESIVHIYFKDRKIIQYGAGLDWTTKADYEGERKIKITTDKNIKIERIEKQR